MPLVYVGNCEFAESNDWQLSRDLYGLDTLTRTWEGRTDHLYAFLKTWPVGKVDTKFPALRLRSEPSISPSGNGAFTRVGMEFVGLIDGTIPPVISEGGWRRQSVTLYQDLTGETTDLEYRAPVTTYKYVTANRPDAPRYERSLILPSVSWQFIGRNGNQAIGLHEVPNFGNVGGHQVYGQVTAGLFNYTRSTVTSIFEFQKAGDYWTVTEQTEGRIMQITGDDAPRQFPSQRIS